MKTQIAAIEFGTSKIVTMIAQSNKGDRLNFIGTGTVPYDGFSEGDWNTPGQMIQRTRDSISAASLEAKTQISEVYVGVPGEYIHVYVGEAEVEIPETGIDSELMDKVQDITADRLRVGESGGIILHRSPAWFCVDDGKKTMSPSGRGQVLRAQTSFVVADAQFVEDINEILSALKITVLGYLSPSLGESYLLFTLEERDRVGLLIDVGYLNTEISVVEGDAIIYHAILPKGGGHITADLATELRIPMRAAEKIKRGYAFTPDEYDRESFSEVFDDAGNRMTFPHEVISDIVERSTDDLADMIEKTINNDAVELLGARSQIYLTGGGLSMMRGACEYLAAKIGRPIKVATAKSPGMNSPVYASACGLADLIFDTVDKQEEADVPLAGRFRNLFRG